MTSDTSKLDAVITEFKIIEKKKPCDLLVLQSVVMVKYMKEEDSMSLERMRQNITL